MTSRPLRVVLKRGRSKPFWLGHPWVFSGGIHRVDGDVGDTGGPCEVVDERDNVLGVGFYNPHARIAVRLIEHRRTTDRAFTPTPIAALLRARLTTAIATRAQLGLPREDTSVFRLVNSEGDLLPGLVVDRLGDVASVQLNARGMYEQRDELVSLIQSLTGVRGVQLSVNETASKLEAIPTMSEWHGPGDDAGTIEVREHGVRYRVDLGSAQKTGFYADQRENRARFAALCGGRSMLDAYCNVGGFGLNAALAGASAVTQVDSSVPALAAAKHNAELNGVSDRVTRIQADAVTFLKEAHALGQRFDRIVVDPPKLARGRSHLQDALKKYARINALAMGLLTEGGLMLSCSCSRHVDGEAFGRMLTEAGHRTRHTVVVHGTWGQPADHPSTSVAPEGRYLDAFLIGIR